MAALKDEDLNMFGKLLDEREAELSGEINDAKDADDSDREGFANVAPDVVDVAQMKVGGDIRHAESERDRVELMEIAAARARLRDGTYGECIDCHEPIAFDRLKAEPWASRCIECQELYERRHPIHVPEIATGRDVGMR